MSEQERCERFIEGMNALIQQYGVTIKASLAKKEYGDMLQLEPQTQLALVDGWQNPPAVSSEG